MNAGGIIRSGAAKAGHVLLCAALLGTAAACSTKGGGGTAAVGVTGGEIHLGVLSDLTGPFKAPAEQQNLGIQLYWDQKNAAGGTCGRRIVLETRDHGYDPQKAVSLAGELNDKVLAYQISVGSPTSLAIRPELEDHRVMAIAMSWSPELGRSPALVVPGTYFDAEAIDAFDYLVERGDIERGDTVGHVYFQGDFGEPALAGLRYAGRRNGVTVKAVQVDPSITDLTSQVAALKDAGVKAIFVNAAPPQLASLAGLSEAGGMDVPIVASMGAYAPQLLDTNVASILEKRALVVGSVTAYSGDAAAATKVRALYEKSNSKVPPSQMVVLGFAISAVLDQAMTRACDGGKTLDRRTLWDVFHGKFTIDTQGATVPLDYSKPGASPSDKIIVLRPAKGVPGGLDVVEADYAGPTVARFADEPPQK
ncbi:urea-binding protein [Mycobacterium tuberculosis]|nr:urea-binding protein [Mycobacterium tuberculosis]